MNHLMDVAGGGITTLAAYCLDMRCPRHRGATIEPAYPRRWTAFDDVLLVERRRESVLPDGSGCRRDTGSGRGATDGDGAMHDSVR